MSETGKVYAAINAVQKALCKEGITKDRKNEQQGYKFRGIDDVYNALCPLLAEHKLCILPRMISREQVERQSARGGVLIYTLVEAEFDFVSAEDGSKHTVRTFGEAMDSADKSCNKSMSSAFKYAAFQTFAIPTEGDNDADRTTHEIVPNTATPVVAAPTRRAPAKKSKEEPQALVELRDEVFKIVKDPTDYDALALWLSGQEITTAKQISGLSEEKIGNMLTMLRHHTSLHSLNPAEYKAPLEYARELANQAFKGL